MHSIKLKLQKPYKWHTQHSRGQVTKGKLCNSFRFSSRIVEVHAVFISTRGLINNCPTPRFLRNSQSWPKQQVPTSLGLDYMDAINLRNERLLRFFLSFFWHLMTYYAPIQRNWNWFNLKKNSSKDQQQLRDMDANFFSNGEV